MVLFILLPVISILLLSTFIWRQEKFQVKDPRESFVISLVMIGGLVAIITELLSLFKILDFTYLFTFWTTLCLFLVYGIYKVRKHQKYWPQYQLSVIEKIYLSFLALLLAWLGFLAIYAAPNNWDGMTYHLPRVMHWTQNQTLAHYPTHNARQIFNPPFAEILLLHTYVLTGNDYFVQLPQWIACVGCVVTTSLLAQYFGADRRRQILIALLVATLPMGLYQATSIQNDYVLALWVVIAYYYYFRLRKAVRIHYLLLLALSFSLAIFTKGAGYIFMLPLVLLYLVDCLRKRSLRLFYYGALLSLVVVAVNISHYSRNIALYGEPLGLIEGKKRHINNSVYGVKPLISNISKTLFYHVRLKNPAMNQAFANYVAGLHRLINVNINDKKISGYTFSARGGDFLYSEDYAPYTTYTILFFSTFLLALIYRESLSVVSWQYVGLLTFMGLLFCVVIAWQSFITRLTLSIYVLSTVWVGLVLSDLIRRSSRYQVVEVLFAVLVSISALTHIYFSGNKRLVGEKNLFNTPRDDYYFVHRPALKEGYEKSAKKIIARNYKKVGLVIHDDAWEYPLWKLLRGQEVEIKHVNVTHNASQKIAQDFQPEVIFFLGEDNIPSIKEVKN
ncbi:MAG: glycosyltransferase family 39 protein [Thermonemataceae bacterium]